MNPTDLSDVSGTRTYYERTAPSGTGRASSIWKRVRCGSSMDRRSYFDSNSA